jgi:hypothetical protein
LYIRKPDADLYCVFQDDVVCCANLRQYLDQYDYPLKAYWNLYTCPRNYRYCYVDQLGWYKSDQRGMGALALVFDRDTLTTLVRQPLLVNKVQDKHRGHRSIDGVVIDSLKAIGYVELVHNPSLVQHLDTESTLAGNPRGRQADTFPGEGFDALSLLLDNRLKKKEPYLVRTDTP